MRLWAPVGPAGKDHLVRASPARGGTPEVIGSSWSREVRRGGPVIRIPLAAPSDGGDGADESGTAVPVLHDPIT